MTSIFKTKATNQEPLGSAEHFVTAPCFKENQFHFDLHIAQPMCCAIR